MPLRFSVRSSASLGFASVNRMEPLQSYRLRLVEVASPGKMYIRQVFYHKESGVKIVQQLSPWSLNYASSYCYLILVEIPT